MRKLGGYILNLRAAMAGVLLFIFASYFANISLFSHYHVVDGVTIVHSHFHGGDHTKNPADQSTHTKSELTFIKILSIYYAETPVWIVIPSLFVTIICTLLIELSAHIILVDHINHPPLRGPPAELLIG